MAQRPPADSESGAAAVEFALIMPLLFLLIFGIFEFGRAYNAQVSLTGAAREGARHMAIENDAAAAQAKVVAAAALPTAPTVVISPTTCGSSGDVTVTATSAITYNIPGFGTGTWNVVGKAVMRCGG